MNIIIFDFEVFKYDTLLGALLINGNDVSLVQTWNLKAIQKLYYDNVDSIWIGHNNGAYDNFILEAIVNGQSQDEIKRLNDDIIANHKRRYLKLRLYWYDLILNHFASLKTLEAYFGKNISESEVDFNLDRHLTDEEKRLTESYNKDDLEQTYDDFYYQASEFKLRLDIINEFNLPLTCLNITGTQLAEEVLHAKAIPGIANWVVKPKLYDNLQVNDEDVKRFFLNREYSEGKQLKKTFCGTEHTIAAGGIHGAKKKHHCQFAYYFDVSGYYNLIMILLDLLPRSIPPEYRALYKHMYEEQLRLKKIDPAKRGVYKTILLSVFGAMNNEYCKFYDPYNGDLVRLSGEMYLIDLLEKLEGLVNVIQSNTDGIIAEPLEGTTEDMLMSVINEWQERTGFVLKLEKVYDIHQRDVNCYMYKDANGEIHTLGEAVKDYGKWEWPFWKESYKSKEPLIICNCIVEYFMNHKLPEEVIEESKDNLRLFQYICKKLSFDWVEYERIDKSTGDVECISCQNVNRAFALKSETHTGMIYKYKHAKDKKGNNVVKRTKVSNLPSSVFIWNESILDDVKSIQAMIDYDYYIKRAYERIDEFINHIKIGDVLVYE